MNSFCVVIKAGPGHKSLVTGQALKLDTLFLLMHTFHMSVSVLSLCKPFETQRANYAGVYDIFADLLCYGKEFLLAFITLQGDSKFSVFLTNCLDNFECFT